MERLVVELEFEDGSRWTAVHPRNGLRVVDWENIAKATFQKWGGIAASVGTPVRMTITRSPNAQVVKSIEW